MTSPNDSPSDLPPLLRAIRRNTVETAATARWLEAELVRLRQELHADSAARRSRAARG